MAIRRLSACVVALFFAFGLVIQGALPAQACTCMMPDPFAGLAQADGAFVGTLVEIDPRIGPIHESMTPVDYRFEVEATLKGDIRDVVVVKSAADGAGCGIELPLGERAGLLLTRENGEWHGNLCWILDADVLLAAAEGPPEPVQGTPPHLVALANLGDAGMVAVDLMGRIVGYGAGPPPWMVSACPDDETFVATGEDGMVRVWSFSDLAVVAENDIGVEPGLSWARDLICIGPGGNSFLVVIEDLRLGTSLVRFVDGQTEILAADIEQLVDTAIGVVAIGGDGTFHGVDPETGELTELIEPVGDLRGRLAAVVPSPDGSRVALSIIDWDTSPLRGRVVMVDLVEGTTVEMEVGCDVYPVWFDDQRVSIWDTCASEVGSIYNTELELIGKGPPPEPGSGVWSVTDETGAVFYLSEFGVTVVEPGEIGTQLISLPTYPTGLLLVPETARATWAGSDFVRGPATDIPAVTLVEPVSIRDVQSGDQPVWLMTAGGVLVAGVLWLLVRKPSAPPPG